MRIAMCTETYVPYVNGVVTQIRLLKQVLESLGHTVLVVTVSKEKKLTMSDGVLRCPSFRVERLYGYRATYPYSRSRLNALAAFKPDIIHIHNEYTLGLFGVYAARTLKVPLVYSIHMDFTAYLGKFPGVLTFLKRPLRRYLGHFVRHADAIVSMSPKAQQYVNQTRYKKNVHLLPNAVRVSRFASDPAWPEKRRRKRTALGLTDTQTAFVYVGRMAPEKRVQELVDLFLSFSFAASEARLFLIGGGPSLEKLQAGTVASGSSDRVQFLGHIDNDDLPDLLFAMDSFVSASMSEMHSMSMLEAMAAGLFCLIKDDPLNNWQIEAEKNGAIWTDAVSLQTQMHRLITEPADQRLARRATVRGWSEANDETVQADRLLQLYATVQKKL